jgi:G3E family GTPase
VANPAPIISTLLLEPSLQDFIRMDGICTVVDAKHVSGHLDRKEETGKENEACAQIAYADRIILNKTDLISESDLAALRARVKAINGLASMQDSVRSVVPIDYVLGIGGYALNEISNQV